MTGGNIRKKRGMTGLMPAVFLLAFLTVCFWNAPEADAVEIPGTEIKEISWQDDMTLMILGSVTEVRGQEIVLKESRRGEPAASAKAQAEGSGGEFSLTLRIKEDEDPPKTLYVKSMPAENLAASKTETLRVPPVPDAQAGEKAAASEQAEEKEAAASAQEKLLNAEEIPLGESLPPVQAQQPAEIPTSEIGIQEVKKVQEVKEVQEAKEVTKQQEISGPGSITVPLTDTAVPVNAAAASGQKLSYSSSDPAVVKADRSGMLHAEKTGSAVIHVKAPGGGGWLPASREIRVKVRKPTAEEGRLAAVAWAVKIANDNRFTYGAGKYAHHNGCYFCRTNGGKARRAKKSRWKGGYKGRSWKRTYCCNPFVHAAYAHGAKVPSMLKACRQMNAIDMNRSSYRKHHCFRYLGKPSFSKLIPGDIFVGAKHVWLYCGENRYVEATSLKGGKKAWSADSIRVKGGARKKYRKCRFVERYKGY